MRFTGFPLPSTRSNVPLLASSPMLHPPELFPPEQPSMRRRTSVPPRRYRLLPARPRGLAPLVSPLRSPTVASWTRPRLSWAFLPEAPHPSSPDDPARGRCHLHIVRRVPTRLARPASLFARSGKHLAGASSPRPKNRVFGSTTRRGRCVHALSQHRRRPRRTVSFREVPPDCSARRGGMSSRSPQGLPASRHRSQGLAVGLVSSSKVGGVPAAGWSPIRRLTPSKTSHAQPTSLPASCTSRPSAHRRSGSSPVSAWVRGTSRTCLPSRRPAWVERRLPRGARFAFVVCPLFRVLPLHHPEGLASAAWSGCFGLRVPEGRRSLWAASALPSCHQPSTAPPGSGNHRALLSDSLLAAPRRRECRSSLTGGWLPVRRAPISRCSPARLRPSNRR